MNKDKRQYYWLFIFTLIAFTAGGCRKEEKLPEYPPGSNENINSWILDSMRVYYYWNNTLPTNPNKSIAPVDFFSSIKNADDKYSRLLNPNFPELYYQSLVWTFGFDLITFQTPANEVQTVISLVVPGSEADREGLKRGDRVSSINNTAPTGANMPALIEQVIKQGSASLVLAANKTVSLTSSVISENPVHTFGVIKKEGRNIAYLFYNFFDAKGMPKLKEAFSYFKNQQANELIIDLRYNLGGDVAVAAALAVMIAPQINADDIFAEFRGNANAGIIRRSFRTALAKTERGTIIDFDEIAASRINISKVVFLTGKNTASAAELVINCLKPYITVTQIGEGTYGKDVASFPIFDNRNPTLVPDWRIEPIVFKLYNSAGVGNYPQGLEPDIAGNELSILPLKPFGDQDDPLVKAAVSRITGKISSVKQLSGDEAPDVLFDSRNKPALLSAPVRLEN